MPSSHVLGPILQDNTFLAFARFCTLLHSFARFCTYLHSFARFSTLLNRFAQLCMLLHAFVQPIVNHLHGLVRVMFLHLLCRKRFCILKKLAKLEKWMSPCACFVANRFTRLRTQPSFFLINIVSLSKKISTCFLFFSSMSFLWQSFSPSDLMSLIGLVSGQIPSVSALICFAPH